MNKDLIEPFSPSFYRLESFSRIDPLYFETIYYPEDCFCLDDAREHYRMIKNRLFYRGPYPLVEISKPDKYEDGYILHQSMTTLGWKAHGDIQKGYVWAFDEGKISIRETFLFYKGIFESRQIHSNIMNCILESKEEDLRVIQEQMVLYKLLSSNTRGYYEIPRGIEFEFEVPNQ